MRKTILILAVAALVVLPSLALAQTEFSLGGYIKLDTFWDSTQNQKNLNIPVVRSNNPQFQHGRFNATAQSSRFNFTIKGPKLWGATTTGFIEMDFDEQGDNRQSASNSYRPRMRHAFFRLNWPGTELLFGQYWSYFSEYYPELVQDGPFQGHGVATHRLAQVRLTQTFGVGWAKNDKVTLSAMVAKPTDPAFTDAPGNSGSASIGGTASGVASNGQITNWNQPLPGQESETPQIQAKVEYEGDLWGKAGFYGRPKPFTAQVISAWQRTRYQSFVTSSSSTDYIRGFKFGGTNLARQGIAQRFQQIESNWAVGGTLFIPVIPTATPNLTGTLAFTAHAYVGNDLNFVGNGFPQGGYFVRRGSAGTFGGVTADAAVGDGTIWLCDRKLQEMWGGYVQANYYFSNEWFINLAMGTNQAYGNGRSDQAYLTDPVKGWWEGAIALYYRPVTALKFGLQYSYMRTDYFQKRTSSVQFIQPNNGGAGSNEPQINPAGAGNARDYGDNHRVEFGAWFFF